MYSLDWCWSCWRYLLCNSDLLIYSSVQCWWVMVLPYLFIVSDLKYLVLKPCFADKDRPVISSRHDNCTFAVDQVISGTGRSDEFNLHSTGKAHCRNWNILGEYGKTLDSASLWRTWCLLASGGSSFLILLCALNFNHLHVLYLHCNLILVVVGERCIFMLFLRPYISFLCSVEDLNEDSVFGKVNFQHWQWVDYNSSSF